MESIPRTIIPATLPKWQVVAFSDLTGLPLGAVTVPAKNTYRAKRRGEIALILDGTISHRNPYVIRARKVRGDA